MGQTWHKPDWPTVGEQLAMHIVVGKGRNETVNELYVGREPWGKGGKLNGKKILDGRIIARAPLGDLSFDQFMLRVAQMIAHMNPDTEIGAQTVELAMSLQSRGVNPLSAMKQCGNCEISRNPDAFTRETEFSWSVNRDHHPRLIGNNHCSFCYRGRLQVFESVLKQAEEIVSKHDGSCDDVLMRGEMGTIYPQDIVAVIGTKRLATQVAKLKRFVNDLKDGKI